MNIQKSRLASVIALAMVVCMIFGMMVVPASAASGMVIKQVKMNQPSGVATAVLASYGVDLQGYKNYGVLVANMSDIPGILCSLLYYGENGKYYVQSQAIDATLYTYNQIYGTNYKRNTNAAHYNSGINDFWELPAEFTKTFGKEFGVNEFTVSYVPAKNLIAENVNGSGISGILDQITELLPVVITFLVGAIAITKAISFITGVLHGA